ncbi:MAG: phosphate ABC transporter permease [Prochloraceae cyanobacterium]
MLVPITREKFEQIVPLAATGPQYNYYWGKVSDLVRRSLISAIATIVTLFFGNVFGGGSSGLMFIFGAIGGFYWLWAPVYQATVRNAALRRIPYSGFWQGKVLDVFVSEELIGEEQTVNQRGELVIIENRERRINLEVGDETGFTALIQAPLNRLHKNINRGDTAELLILSRQPDLGRITKITDAFIPRYNLWVGEYPYLQRDVFAEVSREIGGRARNRDPYRTRRRSYR